MSVTRASTERQLSVNEFRCCILYDPRAVLRHLPIIEALATYIGNIVNVDVAAPENECQQSINTASTECQQSVNDLGCCILCIPRAVLWHLSMIEVLATVLGNMVRVDISTPKN